jgi:hypothetical protein
METTAQVKQRRPRQGQSRQFTALQARIEALDDEVRGRLWKALGAGHDRLSELDEALGRVSREDFSVEGLRRRLETLRVRTEALRESALKRVNELPASALTALATGTRRPVRNLARELERLARLVEPHKAAAKGGAASAASARPSGVPVSDA